MPGANPVTFEPEGTHDTHTGGAKGRRRVESKRSIATCAIAIHNAYGEIHRHGRRHGQRSPHYLRDRDTQRAECLPYRN